MVPAPTLVVKVSPPILANIQQLIVLIDKVHTFPSTDKQSTYMTAPGDTYFGYHTRTDIGVMPTRGHDTKVCTGCTNIDVRGHVHNQPGMH
jgi:hypothetical protein